MHFEARPNKRCQKGLHLEYVVEASVDAATLFTQLEQQGATLLRAEERWGPRTLHRAVQQFRFEVRVGAQDGVVDFLHRASADDVQRREDRALFEHVLAQL